MTYKQLANKPLVEAILEVKWSLKSKGPGAEFDPHYKLILGRLFDRLQMEYPEYEQLPTAMVPDELVGHVVQHRFRKSANAWPLVQLGPGIMTVNDTETYVWPDFQTRTQTAVQKLYGAHPKPADLRITDLTLRYIDAVEFDYTASDVFAFLRDKLKVNLALPGSLFNGTGIENYPQVFVWTSSFRCEQPKGMVHIRFATGQNNGKPSLIWETHVQSAGQDVPPMPDQFENWIESAHKITDDWFFKLIEGELERRFAGE